MPKSLLVFQLLKFSTPTTSLPTLRFPFAISLLLCYLLLADVLQAGEAGGRADSAARVAAGGAFRAHLLAALPLDGDFQGAVLLGAPVPGLHADTAALIAALEAGCAGGRAALRLARGWDGRFAGLRGAHLAGVGADAARGIAASLAGGADVVAALLSLNRDAVGLAVNHLAGGTNVALDIGAQVGRVPLIEDRVGVGPNGGQGGEEEGLGRKREGGHVAGVDLVAMEKDGVKNDSRISGAWGQLG